MNAINLQSFIRSKGVMFDKLNFINDNFLIITKWNWDYIESLNFQKLCVEFVKKNPSCKIFIICNHPHCFTLGRGLQKGLDQKINDLIDFKESDIHKLKFPLLKVKRGGGLTFHYPGQWILYPIVSLNSCKFTIKSLISFLSNIVMKSLVYLYNLKNLESDRAFLGIWKDQYKIASIGIAVDRFVTYHGIALNLLYDDIMFSELLKINPCGLKSNIYRPVDSFLTKKIIISDFNEDITKYLESPHHKLGEENF